jgi:serine/threonine protein kinase
MFNHIFYAGSFVKGSANPYPRRSLSELFAQHTDLSPIQAEAAAGFIRDCLRLNPFDRLTVDQLYEHRWLETAFMGCKDEERSTS